MTSLSIPRYIAFLGRQPELGVAELEALLGAEHIEPFGKVFALVHTASPPKHCGSVMKFARVLHAFTTTDWTGLEPQFIAAIRAHADTLPEGKLTIGLSVYGLNISTKQLGHTSLLVKKSLKQTGRPIRLVPNTSLAMNSAQVIHNKLLHERGIEFCLVLYGTQTLLAQTVWEQPIEAYARRDQARPFRDTHVGMLPPKLAQTIINLATGKAHSTVVLDPFCGTGVVIQEGLLMGHTMYGSDVDERMVDYTKRNIAWLHDTHSVLGRLAAIELGDATTHRWTSSKTLQAVATETFLGKPFHRQADQQTIQHERHLVSGIIKSTLKNLGRQIPSGTRLCLAVPVWFTAGRAIRLPLIDQMSDLGYNLVSFRHIDATSLVYHRKDQVVGRQLLVITKE